MHVFRTTGFEVLIQYFCNKTLDVRTFLLPLCRNGMRLYLSWVWHVVRLGTSNSGSVLKEDSLKGFTRDVKGKFSSCLEFKGKTVIKLYNVSLCTIQFPIEPRVVRPEEMHQAAAHVPRVNPRYSAAKWDWFSLILCRKYRRMCDWLTDWLNVNLIEWLIVDDWQEMLLFAVVARTCQYSGIPDWDGFLSHSMQIRLDQDWFIPNSFQLISYHTSYHLMIFSIVL
jgi:hypothetical protein